MLIFGYRLHLWQCSEAVVSWRHCMAPLLGLCLLLGYRYDYAIHGSPYTSTHVLFENTLVQHKTTKNSRMALCCQNRVFKGTNQHHGLHVCALVTVLGLLKKKEIVKKTMFLPLLGQLPKTL